ncbi:MAG: alanine--glyoxylate aminotransferase family protein [Cyclobacteriaceae bacterium]|nr:alanine--glyoxylate aminotransferase family protein [Cyclobacteriaceae bacterium]
MISFYPGPSRVHDEISEWTKSAQKKGILSMNHRSPEFIELSKKTISLLKKKLSVPKDYTVFFITSATECWEIIAQSLIQSKSIHIYNGAFGEKWYTYTQRLKPESQSIPFDVEASPDLKDLVFTDGDLIGLTQNETSNGTQISNKIIFQVKKNNPDHLIAVDATSSMAGITLDIPSADIWFASVQKCFGLPAGLAVMLCSPRAIERMSDIKERNHYNSLSLMKEMMDKWQTPYTPNVLGIYLLYRAVKKMNRIENIDLVITKRQKDWIKYFKSSKKLNLLIKNYEVRSKTVVTIAGEPMHIDIIKIAAKKRGLLLGEGYGELKNSTFRIANFPAIKPKEIKKLRKFLKAYC